jgi:6-pyruvoyltetrahydropterin/6-carboxytetrahydropterin synthase
MLIRIAKTFTFDAAHFLPKVPDGHKCKRMHGHTYRVEVICGGRPGDDGMILDYQVLADAWARVHELLDHRVLNDIPGLENPTTELQTKWPPRSADVRGPERRTPRSPPPSA